ncbi:Caspase-1 [Oopsacas minuta]|uniref:Caspase-1 n=1 Tax=Oopsacas minuta TaxID=111878 RepID=A0AAV7K821_9METZ|nr:Caspase-1 [Oopsacas minuta]
MNIEDGHSLQEISSDANLTADQSADEKTDGASAKITPQLSPPGNYPIRKLGDRGLGIVICNVNFVSPFRRRNAASADIDNMSRLFHKMGLRVETYSNLSGPEMKHSIAKYSDRDLSCYDCLFLAVSTHGDRGTLIGTDGVPVSIESSVLSPFNGARCPSLCGKPKVFFLQACRGGEKDFCLKLPENETDGNGAAIRLIERIRDLFSGASQAEAVLVPTELDFFIAYSTVPGYVSWRNTEKGSWFMYALFECYMAYGNEVHLAELMTYVTDYVATYFSDTDKETKRIAKQVVCYESRLSKFLKVAADRPE